MRKRKVVFRVDGSSAIGLGHISRCCALADMLKNDFEIHFYTRTGSPSVVDDIKKYCKEAVALDNAISYEEEALSWVSVLTGDEIVVLDGYNFKTFYQQKIKDKGCRLVCIDDIHAYHFVADVVINHAPGIDEKEYSVEPYTQFYLGTEYVLLKKIFLDAAVEKPEFKDLEASPVLICFGGADSNDITRQTLEEIIQLLPQKKLHVVLGAAYNHLSSLENFIQEKKYITLYQNIKPETMLRLMQQSHIAIISASTTALEYICAKGNLFLKIISDNQKEIYQSLIKKTCAYPYESLTKEYLLTSTINNQYRLIDGKSSERLSKIFNELSFNKDNVLCFKIAQSKDADLLFEWINDPEVRNQSLSTNAISYTEHISWFSKKLLNKNCYFYIAYKNSIPAGMIRFDICADECKISYLVDAAQRGKGIGAAIINCGVKQFIMESKFNGWLKAEVKNTNAASLKIFESSEFEKENEDMSKGIVSFKKLIAC